MQQRETVMPALGASLSSRSSGARFISPPASRPCATSATNWNSSRPPLAAERPGAEDVARRGSTALARRLVWRARRHRPGRLGRSLSRRLRSTVYSRSRSTCCAPSPPKRISSAFVRVTCRTAWLDSHRGRPRSSQPCPVLGAAAGAIPRSSSQRSGGMARSSTLTLRG